MTGYSVTHYYRLFNKETGLSVANYISKRRINHALFEILAGRKAIDAVLEYGFDTYAGFYKAFVKMHGCSPMKYLTYHKNLTQKELENILMEYNLTEQQKERITKYYGNSFYSKMLENFDLYLEKWKLVDFEFIEDFDGSYHHIKFFCKSELYGDCVLKIYDDDEILVEYSALLEYNGCGDHCVKALGYEPSDKMQGAILTQRVFPGKSLMTEEPSLEKRLEIYSGLFSGMHIETKNPDIYYSYTHWVNTIGMPDELLFGDREAELKDFENLKELQPELYPHALKAKEIYLNLLCVYDKKLLLHGRLDSYNIKSCGNGKYKVANPVGVVGDPVFEAGSFIFWECFKWHEITMEPEKAETIIGYLEKRLNIPDKILRQVFYIATVMAYWGNDKDKYPEDTIKFAESVMLKGK
jgi:AraC-like DNA-binding protein